MIVVVAPAPSPASRPIKSAAQFEFPPNNADRRLRPDDMNDDAGSVNCPVLTPVVMASAGVRDAASTTCCITPRSALLFAMAPKMVAVDNANPRETACSDTPNRVATCPIVDGWMLDVSLVRRDSAMCASLRQPQVGSTRESIRTLGVA